MVIVAFKRRDITSEAAHYCHMSIVDVCAYLDELGERDWAEVGAVEVRLQPARQHVQVRQRRAHAHDLNVRISTTATPAVRPASKLMT